MASLTSKQMFAEERILEGHNIILTGQAGTRKSFLLRDVALTVGYNNIIFCRGFYSVVDCLD